MYMKNVHSFFSWQGNQWDWPAYSKWIVLGITFALLLLTWIFKKQIRAFFKRHDEQKMDKWLSYLGVFLFAFQVFKLILYVVGDYPLRWELLWLHICRIHMLIIAVLLMARKKEYIKFITYISTMGAIAAMWFGTQTWSSIVGENKEAIFVNEGIKFYHVGVDNFFFWDFFVFHISIVMIPVVLWTGFGWKLKTVNLYRTALIYAAGIIFIWLFNWALTQSTDNRWWANNWYIGMDKANDFKHALGVLSAWPQNLFAYLILGIVVLHVSHYVWILQSSDRKQLWKDYISGYKNIHKKLLQFK